MVAPMNWIFLQVKNPITDVTSAGSYLPIAIQLIFAILFVGAMMALTHWLGPKRNTADKL